MNGVQVPQLLQGRYELGPVLGVGGMARVHRGHDTLLGRPVAIKVFGADADVARVRDESRALAALNHPGLVDVYDAGTTDADGVGLTYLVMELVDGPTLARCCLDGSLPTDEVARIGAELAQALAHAHDRGVIHRDVKPANILLDPDRRAKLTDFGIAQLVDGARHTAIGTTVGTAPYLSPEQVTGRPVGPPADVYALGLVLLECLTGAREYPGQGVEAALARLHRLPRIPPFLPVPWPDLLAAMTDTDPERRPSAAAVAAALRTGPPPAAEPGREPAPTAVLTAGTRLAPVAPTAPGRGERGQDSVVRSVARDTVGNRFVLAVAAALLLLVALVAVLAGTGPASPSSRPPASQLDRDLHDLTRAVTP